MKVLRQAGSEWKRGLFRRSTSHKAFEGPSLYFCFRSVNLCFVLNKIISVSCLFFYFPYFFPVVYCTPCYKTLFTLSSFFPIVLHHLMNLLPVGRFNRILQLQNGITVTKHKGISLVVFMFHNHTKISLQ